MVDRRQFLEEILVKVLCLLSLEAVLRMNMRQCLTFMVVRESCLEETTKTVNTTCLMFYRFFYLFIKENVTSI